MAVSERDIRSWSFTDRSFLFALAVSVLWHLFWFFSVRIIVTPLALKKQVNTALVSLGPVLDDAIFRTLVETRPEVSQAFYRELSDFESATELPAQKAERHETGDVTSLPMGEKFESTLRRLVGGDKISPEYSEGTANLFSGGSYFTLTGDITPNDILSRPKQPSMIALSPVEIEFEVDSAGNVASTEVTLSSGDTALDTRWEDHLRQWLFSPAPVLGEAGRLRGKVTFRRAEEA